MRISDIVNFSRTGHISQPKSWKGQVKKLIIRNGFAESSFTFKEFFNHIDTITSISIGYLLGKCFPDSNTIRSSVRHTLQKLRDEEFLTFIDYKGTYKVSEVVRDDLRNTRAMTGQKLWRGYLARKEVKQIRERIRAESRGGVLPEGTQQWKCYVDGGWEAAHTAQTTRLAELKEAERVWEAAHTAQTTRLAELKEAERVWEAAHTAQTTRLSRPTISSDDEEFGSFVRNYHSNEYRRGAKKPRPTNHIIAYGYGIEGWI